MKETELMIGDWIKVLSISHKVEPHYDRIESIRKEYTGQIYIEGGYHDREHNGVRDWFDWSVGLDYIAPIPLTEEILKKNGFESQGNSIYRYFKVYADSRYYEFESMLYDLERKNLKVTKEYRNGYQDSINIFYAQYVHELQHALRLCGLNKLADNFKI